MFCSRLWDYTVRFFRICSFADDASTRSLMKICSILCTIQELIIVDLCILYCVIVCCNLFRFYISYGRVCVFFREFVMMLMSNENDYNNLYDMVFYGVCVCRLCIDYEALLDANREDK